jgi:hypothetical protein
MDALDRLSGPADDLLVRVDRALGVSGAPETHPIWPLLRRVGALPGAAVSAVSGLRPAPLAAAAPSLRTLARWYAEASVAAGAPQVRRTDAGGPHESVGVGGGAGWEGAAAEAFADQWGALSAYLAGVGESLSARLEATAAFADSLAAWMARTRGALAEALARVLASAEAVSVVSEPAVDGWITRPAAAPTALRACADIGAAVLAPVALAYEQAGELAVDWPPRLAELPFRPRSV